MRCGGRTFAPGDIFDKTLVTTRRLRQLYDVTPRRLRMTPEAEQALPPDEQADASESTPETAQLPLVDPLAAFEGMRWLSICKEIKQLTGVWPNNKAHAVEVMTLHLAATGGKEPENGTAPLQSE